MNFQSEEIKIKIEEEEIDGCEKIDSQILEFVVKDEDEFDLLGRKKEEILFIDEVKLELEFSEDLSPKKDESPKQTFECQECGKFFQRKEYLTKHVKTVHSDTKSFVCQECGKYFKRKRTLLQHKQIVHEKLKPYECKDCGKPFASNNDLLRHSRIHDGVKPFECQECGKTFRQKHHLNDHQKVVHGGLKRVKLKIECQECGKCFGNRGD